MPFSKLNAHVANGLFDVFYGLRLVAKMATEAWLHKNRKDAMYRCATNKTKNLILPPGKPPQCRSLYKYHGTTLVKKLLGREPKIKFIASQNIL